MIAIFTRWRTTNNACILSNSTAILFNWLCSSAPTKNQKSLTKVECCLILNYYTRSQMRWIIRGKNRIEKYEMLVCFQPPWMQKKRLQYNAMQCKAAQCKWNGCDWTKLIEVKPNIPSYPLKKNSSVCVYVYLARILCILTFRKVVSRFQTKKYLRVGVKQPGGRERDAFECNSNV